MSPDLNRSEMVSWALDAGFDRAGWAVLAPSDNTDAFQAWLARGDHAGMTYLERRPEVRLDPCRILPGARSVLCVALRYHPLASADECGSDLWHRVARYARGEDYHRVMMNRLRRLESRIRHRHPEAETRVYVDTGPVLERELAARAGVGSVGKNTNLLDAEIGSWFLLGEIFLTLDCEPAVPAADLCGTCSLCLEACPTGALPEPYRLDSRRCISYWTIEHRGPIPKPVRPLVGEWVFGCDVCQEVCPVNLELGPVVRPEFEIPAQRRSLDLRGMLTMSREDYTEMFRHSPMKRSKLQGLKRNAAVAMGNSGSDRFAEALATALTDEDEVVRAHAAWALGQIGDRRARLALRRARAAEAAAAVQAEIESAIEVSG